jgi:hypothetical protein
VDFRGRAERRELPAKPFSFVERPEIVRWQNKVVKAKTTTSCDFIVGQSQYLAFIVASAFAPSQ